MSKNTKVKEPEEGDAVYFLCNDGEVCKCGYIAKVHFFAWRTKQLFLTQQEAEDYKRFLLIESQIREIAERIDGNEFKSYLKNIDAFRVLVQYATDKKEKGGYSQIYIDFASAILDNISSEDLKFYFEYER